MILRLKQPVDAVLESFSWADDTLVEPFRDATYSRPDFGLTLATAGEGLPGASSSDGSTCLPSLSEDEDYHRKDFLQGSEIPAVISPSRLVPIIATSLEPMVTARLGQMVTLSPRRLAEQPFKMITVTGWETRTRTDSRHKTVTDSSHLG
jgi:hypothetical protein